jgi:FMN phosphatase YigB (HAD superfamily)
MKQSEPIVLFDMDGTLCDLTKSLLFHLNEIKSPNEPFFTEENLTQPHPDYLEKRISLIYNNQSFWENLPVFQLGWDVYNLTSELDYKTMILTQAPRSNPFSLAEN